MKRLNARFSPNQIEQLTDVAIDFDVSASKLARAAIKIGLEHLLQLSAIDMSKAEELIAVSEFKAR